MADYSRDQDIGKATEETVDAKVTNISSVTDELTKVKDVLDKSDVELKKLRSGAEELVDHELEEPD